MKLTNYWWLLIWMFAVGGVMAFFLPKRKEYVCGREEYRWEWLPAILLALPYVIWAGTRGYFGDTYNYMKSFENVPGVLSQIPGYLAENEKDKGFTVLMVVFKAIFSDSSMWFFLAIAAFQMLCIVAVYRKYSTDYWISMFLFIASTDYLSWMQNGIRQFIAVTAIFAGFGLLLKRKYAALLCLILLASTVHGSALIMIPIVLIIRGKALNRRTMLLLAAMAAAVLFIGKLTPILNDVLVDTQYNDMVMNEIWINDDGTNMLRVLVYSIPAILAVVGKRYIDREDDMVVNISVNASFVSSFLYLVSAVSSGIYIGRLPIYVSLASYITLPWLIDNMFTEKSARFVKLAMILGYLAFFYYQMHITWALI